MSTESKVSVLRGDVAADTGTKTVFKVLLAISFCHLLNDTVQSLLPAFILPRGQRSIAWFSFVALLGIILLADIGAWTKRRRAAQEKLQAAPPLAGHVVESIDAERHAHLPRKKILWSLAILVA